LRKERKELGTTYLILVACAVIYYSIFSDDHFYFYLKTRKSSLTTIRGKKIFHIFVLLLY